MKILVLTSMFPDDMKKTYEDFIKLNEQNDSPFHVLSPISLIDELKDAYYKTIAVALHITSIVLEHKSPNHPLVYIGPALKDVTYDKVYSINRDVIKRQESFIESLAEQTTFKETLDRFYKIDESEKDFRNIEEFFFFLKEV